MKHDMILLDHGSGGRLSHDLIRSLFLPEFSNDLLNQLDDSAVIELNGLRLAFSTDSYVVDPIFFPGGDIGSLAVHGTVNDLAMRGAKPLCLSAAFIIEEGFPAAHLTIIAQSMRRAAQDAEVTIVTGDTKVVPKGAMDKIFINTAGIGIVDPGINISGHNAKPGDMIVLSGMIADHGITVLTCREGLRFDTSLRSDSAPLNGLVAEMLGVSHKINVLRDPTRGGLGTSLNEIAEQSQTGMILYENDIPVRDEVRGACELLGLDPLYLANEGKLVACISAEDADKVLDRMRKNPYGKDSCIIGEVTAEHPGRVVMRTGIGGTRIVDMLTAEPLPRIC
ncbi:MAG: hydrogenase expression/formation protein HypE [Pseudomonadota bacterium]